MNWWGVGNPRLLGCLNRQSQNWNIFLRLIRLNHSELVGTNCFQRNLVGYLEVNVAPWCRNTLNFFEVLEFTVEFRNWHMSLSLRGWVIPENARKFVNPVVGIQGSVQTLFVILAVLMRLSSLHLVVSYYMISFVQDVVQLPLSLRIINVRLKLNWLKIC